MEEEKVKQEIQQKYLEVQLYTNHLKALQKQVEALDEQLMELHGVAQGLVELNSAKVGSEMLVPMTNGIFIKSTLSDNQSLLVNVGGNTVVPKDIGAAKELISKRIFQIDAHRGEYVKELEQLVDQIQALEKELNELVKSLQ